MNQVTIRKSDVLPVLRSLKVGLAERYGVTKLGVFGSVARDEATASSDVDVVLEMQKPDLFYLVHIKDELENAIHTHVDVIQYREYMNPDLKRRIDRDAVYV